MLLIDPPPGVKKAWTPPELIPLSHENILNNTSAGSDSDAALAAAFS